jgi:hypothetical protein
VTSAAGWSDIGHWLPLVLSFSGKLVARHLWTLEHRRAAKQTLANSLRIEEFAAWFSRYDAFLRLRFTKG